LLARPSLLRECVALDISDGFKTEDGVHWALSSHRAKELRDAKFMNKYMGLMNEDPEELSFFKADFGNHDDMSRFKKRYFNKKFPFISASAVFHQQSSKKREQWLQD